MMFGQQYLLMQTHDGHGNRTEQWVLDDHKDSNMVDPALLKLAHGCNTSKDKHFRKTKIAGINVVSRPCGIILSMEELYGSESLSQVLLPIHSLMKMPSVKDNVKGHV